MHRGLTLIEVLVTLSLLAIAAAGLFGFYATGIMAGQHARALAVATGLAQARLEQLKADPPAITSNGQPMDTRPAGLPGYSWATETARVAPGLSQVTVIVTWTQRGRLREATLTTLVRTPKAP